MKTSYIKTRISFILIIVSFFVLPFPANAREATMNLFGADNDTIKVSLLTCSPGKRIYELYGHTGIRVNIPARRFDAVYHYGVFSFNTPHFTYRFVKGETDYSIGIMPYYDFVSMYAERGSEVRELPLNLTAEETQRLFKALNINALPSNAVYRYSFLYDNCATRPRDIIARNVDGYLVYSPQAVFPTYRDMIHYSTRSYPWMTFGIDLLLGKEVDCRVDFVATPFLPTATETLLAEASVEEPGGALRPLATGEPKVVLKSSAVPTEPSIFTTLLTPWVVNLVLLLAVLCVTVVELRRGKHCKILDTLLFAIFGTTGVLIYFLLLFSEHPAVSSNYNALWLHPFWYVAAAAIWINKAGKFLYYYHFINFALVLGLILAFAFIPQKINTACIPLMVILLVRSFAYIAVEKGAFRKAPAIKTDE